MDSSERLLSRKEVSAKLGCSPDTVGRLVVSGRLKAIKLTENSTRRHRRYVTLRISSLEVERFIRSNAA
jgi:hypothetical protein